MTETMAETIDRLRATIHGQGLSMAAMTREAKEAQTMVTVPLDGIRGIGLVDFAKLNEQRKGMRDAFPLVVKQ
jgi:hypothetical protein